MKIEFHPLGLMWFFLASMFVGAMVQRASDVQQIEWFANIIVILFFIFGYIMQSSLMETSLYRVVK